MSALLRLRRRAHGLRGPTLVLLGAIAFGAMAAAVANSPRDASPATLSLVRAIVMAGVALPLAAPHLRRAFGPGGRWLWARCIAGAIAILCYFENLGTLGAGLARALGNLSPVFVLMLSPIVLGERLRSTAVGAVLVTVLGVGIAASARPLAELQGAPLALGLMGAAATAVAYVALRRASTEFPGALVLVCLGGCTALSCGLGMLFTGADWPDQSGWTVAVGVALLGTFGQALLTRGARDTPTPVLNALQSSALVFGVLFEWALGGRTPAFRECAGYVLILGGSAYLHREPRRPSVVR